MARGTTACRSTRIAGSVQHDALFFFLWILIWLCTGLNCAGLIVRRVKRCSSCHFRSV